MSDWNVTVRLDPRVRPDRQRLSLSLGVREVINDSTYEPNARVPISFEPLPDAALAALIAEHPFSRSRTVSVLPFSGPLLSELRRAAHSSRREALQEALPSVLSELAETWSIMRAPRSLGLGQNPPGMATVTRDPRSGLLVGLHVDTFEAYNEDRTSAGNRVSINIGRAARDFLFVPYDFRALALAGNLSQASSVVRRFFESQSAAPVVRLRIHPGEAYIAPTESLIHDAGSSDSCDRDLHVTALGCFEPKV
jgi:hypothetical protein